jgi:hypothetical protein
MAKNVLLLGRKGIVLDDVAKHLDVRDVNLHSGTGLEDVWLYLGKRKSISLS